MLKTSAIEKPPQHPELKGFTDTETVGGQRKLKLVGGSNTSDSTLLSSPPKLPEDKLRPSSKASSLAFSWERFSGIAHELPPLFSKHWQEIALNRDIVPLQPDWDKFYQLDITNILRVLTVRDNGILVGYLFGLFGPHLHYASTPYGHADMFWIDPLYRQGWTGVRMFKELLRAAKEWGIVVVSVPIKLHFMNARVGKLLERLGFKAIEVIYSRRV